jgi:hypothetical protein
MNTMEKIVQSERLTKRSQGWPIRVQQNSHFVEKKKDFNSEGLDSTRDALIQSVKQNTVEV